MTDFIQWFWLSFADPTQPAGSQHLGSTMVAGANEFDAIAAAHAAKINPGGQVLLLPMEPWVVSQVPAAYRGRLLSKADVDELEVIFMARRECQGTA